MEEDGKEQLLRKSCDYCARMKRACDGGAPCALCRRRGKHCGRSVRRKSGPAKGAKYAPRRSRLLKEAAALEEGLSKRAASTAATSAVAAPAAVKLPKRSGIRNARYNGSPRGGGRGGGIKGGGSDGGGSDSDGENGSDAAETGAPPRGPSSVSRAASSGRHNGRIKVEVKNGRRRSKYPHPLLSGVGLSPGGASGSVKQRKSTTVGEAGGGAVSTGFRSAKVEVSNRQEVLGKSARARPGVADVSKRDKGGQAPAVPHSSSSSSSVDSTSRVGSSKPRRGEKRGSGSSGAVLAPPSSLGVPRKKRFPSAGASFIGRRGDVPVSYMGRGGAGSGKGGGSGERARCRPSGGASQASRSDDGAGLRGEQEAGRGDDMPPPFLSPAPSSSPLSSSSSSTGAPTVPSPSLEEETLLPRQAGGAPAQREARDGRASERRNELRSSPQAPPLRRESQPRQAEEKRKSSNSAFSGKRPSSERSVKRGGENSRGAPAPAAVAKRASDSAEQRTAAPRWNGEVERSRRRNGGPWNSRHVIKQEDEEEEDNRHNEEDFPQRVRAWEPSVRAGEMDGFYRPQGEAAAQQSWGEPPHQQQQQQLQQPPVPLPPKDLIRWLRPSDGDIIDIITNKTPSAATKPAPPPPSGADYPSPGNTATGRPDTMAVAARPYLRKGSSSDSQMCEELRQGLPHPVGRGAAAQNESANYRQDSALRKAAGSIGATGVVASPPTAVVVRTGGCGSMRNPWHGDETMQFETRRIGEEASEYDRRRRGFAAEGSILPPLYAGGGVPPYGRRPDGEHDNSASEDARYRDHGSARVDGSGGAGGSSSGGGGGGDYSDRSRVVTDGPRDLIEGCLGDERGPPSGRGGAGFTYNHGERALDDRRAYGGEGWGWYARTRGGNLRVDSSNSCASNRSSVSVGDSDSTFSRTYAHYNGDGGDRSVVATRGQEEASAALRRKGGDVAIPPFQTQAGAKTKIRLPFPRTSERHRFPPLPCEPYFPRQDPRQPGARASGCFGREEEEAETAGMDGGHRRPLVGMGWTAPGAIAAPRGERIFMEDTTGVFSGRVGSGSGSNTGGGGGGLMAAAVSGPWRGYDWSLAPLSDSRSRTTSISSTVCAPHHRGAFGGVLGRERGLPQFGNDDLKSGGGGGSSGAV